MSKRKTTEQFIRDAIAVHGEKYDYSQSIYTTAKAKIVIGCPTHGVFNQTAQEHTQGQGCAKCGLLSRTASKRLSTAEFIIRAQIVHSGKYSYASSVYTRAADLIVITCPVHGIFYQRANNHLLGAGCNKCGIKDAAVSRASTASIFASRAEAVHGKKYTYGVIKYANRNTPVEIICHTHGVFLQAPNNHLAGKGCSKCANIGPSKGEIEVRTFCEHVGITPINSVRNMLSGSYELDMVFPTQKLAIEFNGLIWHSERYGKGRDYHQNKTEMALRAGYRLVHLWQDEWDTKRGWCEAFLRMQLVGPDRKLYARKCKITPLTTTLAQSFHEEYHLQGRRDGENFGVLHGEELVAVATFRGGELARWTVKFGVVIVGALSKMAKHYGKPFISYCDTAKHTGAGYLKAGFTLTSESPPSYWYTDGQKRFNRVGFQKHKLATMPGTAGDTEREMANSIGLYQIGGCRQLKFTYNP